MSNASEPKKPRIHVISRADQNAGRIVGRWLDADQPAEVLQQEVARICAEWPSCHDEGWIIYEHEGFGRMYMHPLESMTNVARLTELMRKHGPWFAELAGDFGGSQAIEDALECVENGFLGAFESDRAFGESLVREACGPLWDQIPEYVRQLINYERAASIEMACGGGTFVEHDGMTLYFTIPWGDD